MSRPELVPEDPVPDPAPPPDLSARRVPLRMYSLKHGDTFLVADALGNIAGDDDGLFHNDTRILSRSVILLGGRLPSLLGAGLSQDNAVFTSHATNRTPSPLGDEGLPEGAIHLQRSMLLWDGRLYQQVRVENFGQSEVQVPVAIHFGADFRDMFEVRGATRLQRGRLAKPEVSGDTVVLGYTGLDRVGRRAVIRFSETPQRLDGGTAEFRFRLPGHGAVDLHVEVGPDEAGEAPGRTRFRRACARARRRMRTLSRHGTVLRSSGRLFNDWVDKSRADLSLLVTELPTGPYPYAGIPWFSTTFGRDAIITALQTLWLSPALAQGVLRFLASRQAREESAFKDAQPGKIMHEARRGEMVALGELPFAEYYGGVDTTPLFVMLAGAYASRTGDMALIDELWPALLRAIAWVERRCDGNSGGFLDYARSSEKGLANQGWKDSHDSVFHADGRFPDGPIALVEVQGYAFAALRTMGDFAAQRGLDDEATRWRVRAEALRVAVEDRFWMEDQGFYALALDGHGEPCRVRASNAGHLLYCGLPAPDRAASVTRQLLDTPFESGWGIRTLARGEANFNPMSYHNGSVWPHDGALCAAGLARYGERDGVVRLLSGLFETAVNFDMRLPELFCGFPRVRGEKPIAYPVACLPQAWASGAVFMMLQGCLGLRVDGLRSRITVDRPRLPIGIESLTVEALPVGPHRVTLGFQRIGDRVVVSPQGTRPPEVDIIIRM
ncbi:amylo-alpha-1,6-glucosidase [Inquilinus limosus]|uniref:Amylo-alpha-1,6-glucosidase n=1 Tax=Inquilinus limosus TaxID=171674 RepID=A0A211ZKG4_9PROT|nr:amylo-alpha-1,6-glucosidase [Inquilinus limosus]OWJ65684.1 amylo-alpha-1,6-glucosidase [Inquilinus limosus]